MAANLIGAYARSGWRIRLLFSGGDPSTLPLSNFTLTRTDGGSSTIKLVNVFGPDTGQLELVTSEPLVRDVSYNVTSNVGGSGLGFPLGGGGGLGGAPITLPVVFSLAPDDSIVAVQADDPESELFGVDLDWIFGQPAADGDCPRRSGQECLRHDLATRAVLKKKELVHLPNAGADLPDGVNGPAGTTDLLAIQATLDAEFRDDDRVADVGVSVTADPNEGGYFFNANIIPIGTGRRLRVSNT